MYTYSEEHNNYLKKKKQEKIIVKIFQFLIIILFLILWEFFAHFNLINTFLLSSPSKVINTLYSLIINGELFKHIGITLYEVLLSFFISIVIGFFISLIFWCKTILYKIIEPYLTVLNSLPKVALGPLIIILVGSSTNSIIFMALLISTFITIINIYNGFISTDISYITLLKSFGASKKQIFLKVILPSNYSNIINTLKINISMSLIGLLPPVGENFIV